MTSARPTHPHAQCERVKFFMQRGANNAKCVFERNARKWHHFKDDEKRVGFCETFKQVGGGVGKSICADLFPEDEAGDIFSPPADDSESRFLTIKRVFVSGTRRGIVKVADFGGARLLAGESLKKQAV